MDSIHSYFNPNFNQTIALPTPLSFQTKKSQTAYEKKYVQRIALLAANCPAAGK
jgi:hypothetical protein